MGVVIVKGGPNERTSLPSLGLHNLNNGVQNDNLKGFIE